MLKDSRFLKLTGITTPIVQSPMAGAQDHRLAIAVSAAGALGSIPCAMLDTDGIDAEINAFNQSSAGPLNLNFFCHKPLNSSAATDKAWKQCLATYYDELGVDIDSPAMAPVRNPFDHTTCELVEIHKPAVVSFHFGLPDAALVDRVKATGATVMSSATTPAEARWLEQHGCDVIIAQGLEAGGHRGLFLSHDLSGQSGLMALLPAIIDAVSVPVVAAGAIGDSRAIVAALSMGAAAVQIGTAYLLTPQSLISDLHKQALKAGTAEQTALTNIFSGRPARSLRNRIINEIGPIAAGTPAFPTAGAALAPLKTAAEKIGKNDFSSLWAGQAVHLCIEQDAQILTEQWINEAKALTSPFS